MDTEKIKKKPSTAYAAFVLIGVLVIVLGGNILLSAPIQPMFLIVWLFVIPACMKLGYTYSEIEASMLESIKNGMGAVLILMAVGSVISTWISAGTVPSIIYYGLSIISPKIFLLATFILCSMVSLACGTSWGTMGTAGIALFAVGESLGVPTGLTVGAIVSGSYLGDMISPMSDSTNVVSAATGANLITHCKELLYIAAPVTVITAIIYYVLGLRFAATSFDNTYIMQLQSDLSSIFKMGIVSFIPMILLFTLIIMKKPAMISMVISSISACLVSVVYQGFPKEDAINVFWTGFKIESGDAFIDTLLNRGGVQSMFATVCMMIFAFGMIGAFNKAGFLDAILAPITKKIKSITQLTAVSQIISIIGNTLGTNTFSLLMTGTLMKPVYDEYSLHPTNLSKAINATSTVICPLIPWNASGIYVVALFGVGTLSFAPYAFYSYLMPIAAFIFAALKIRVIPANVDLEKGGIKKQE